MPDYVMDWAAKTAVRAAVLRQKLQIKLAIFHSHILTPIFSGLKLTGGGGGGGGTE